MKSGTTSVHAMLAARPDVFIPRKEVHFFCCDEPESHADFFVHRGRRWHFLDYEFDRSRAMAWYASWFAEAAPEHVIGEDSTTYLLSESAPRRIREVLPDVKLIFLLRDPVARAYSHYWHLVRTGRATRRFEDETLQRPGILRHSHYLPALRRYHEIFPSANIQVLLFEEFVADPDAAIAGLAQFLGLDDGAPADAPRWSNRGVVPRFVSLRLFVNRLTQPLARERQTSHLPGMPRPRYRWLRRCLDAVNRLNSTPRRPPPIRPETQTFLERQLGTRNSGLSAMLGRDLSQHWPWFAAYESGSDPATAAPEPAGRAAVAVSGQV